MGHTGQALIYSAGCVSKPAGFWLTRDDAHADFVGHDDEIAGRSLNACQEGLDLGGGSIFDELVVEKVAKPHGHAINDGDLDPGRERLQGSGQINGRLYCLERRIPLTAMLLDTSPQLLIQGLGSGDEGLLPVTAGQLQSVAALAAPAPSGYEDDAFHGKYLSTTVREILRSSSLKISSVRTRSPAVGLPAREEKRRSRVAAGSRERSR
jgi:hypothetical protein